MDRYTHGEPEYHCHWCSEANWEPTQRCEFCGRFQPDSETGRLMERLDRDPHAPSS